MALCRVRSRDGITIAALPPTTDHVAAMTLEKELRELAAREPKALLLDFSGTKYISSSGLRVFLQLAKRAKASGIPFGGVLPHGSRRPGVRDVGVCQCSCHLRYGRCRGPGGLATAGDARTGKQRDRPVTRPGNLSRNEPRPRTPGNFVPGTGSGFGGLIHGADYPVLSGMAFPGQPD